MTDQHLLALFDEAPQRRQRGDNALLFVNGELHEPNLEVRKPPTFDTGTLCKSRLRQTVEATEPANHITIEHGTFCRPRWGVASTDRPTGLAQSDKLS